MLAFQAVQGKRIPLCLQNIRQYSNANAPSISGHYDVVIAGGGAIGTSVGYHLSKHSAGLKPLLLEQASLTAGTTWHAASLIGTVRASPLESAISRYTRYYMDEIEQETGYSPGFKNTTSLQLACSKQRMEMIQRTKAFADTKNLETEIIDVDRARELCPYLDYDGVIGALHVKEDGVCTSTDLVQCYAKGMQQNGGRIEEQCRILKVEPIKHGMNGFKIETNKGTVTSDYFVNCGGQWARKIGELSGVHIPMASCEHFYVISRPSESLPKVDTMMPVVRDPDSKSGYIYYREWSGGIMAGSFEKHAKVAYSDDDHHHYPPDDFQFGLFDDDWDHFEPMMDDIFRRCPLFKDAEVQMVNGPESFTIDTKYMMGDVNECFNYYVAAGMNSSGIVASNGFGKLLSGWIIHGHPGFYDGDYKYHNKELYEIEKDLFSSYPTALDIKRFHPYSKCVNVQINGTKESLSAHNPLADSSGLRGKKCVQNIRCSPAYHYQKWKQHAHFMTDTQSAFSVPAYFGKEVHLVKDSIYGSHSSQPLVDQELEAYHNGESLIFDRSVDPKWLLMGNDVEGVLFNSEDERYTVFKSKDVKRMNEGDICSVMVVDKKSGLIELCGDLWKLDDGRHESAEEQYLLRCGTNQHGYLNKKSLIEGAKVGVDDASSQFTVFHVTGKDILYGLAAFCHSGSVDKLYGLKTSNGRFEWIDLGSFRVMIGGPIKFSSNCCAEKGEYQIMVSSDYAPHFYEWLCETKLVKPAGYLAWDAIRIRNGMTKYNTDFDATYFKKAEDGTKCMVLGVVEDCEYAGHLKHKEKPVPFGGEPVVNGNDECFGFISSLRYRGHKFERHFIANLDAKCFTEKELKVRVGNEYIGCNIKNMIQMPNLVTANAKAF